MEICFLFGHRDAPQRMMGALEQAIEDEILRGTRLFYVGNHGKFDSIAGTVLRKVKCRYSEIEMMLLLAHHPSVRAVETPLGFDGTYFPPIENVPPKFALERANRYMIKKADSIICYAKYPGNAMKLWELSRRQSEIRQLRRNNLAVTE